MRISVTVVENDNTTPVPGAEVVLTVEGMRLGKFYTDRRGTFEVGDASDELLGRQLECVVVHPKFRRETRRYKIESTTLPLDIELTPIQPKPPEVVPRLEPAVDLEPRLPERPWWHLTVVASISGMVLGLVDANLGSRDAAAGLLFCGLLAVGLVAWHVHERTRDSLRFFQLNNLVLWLWYVLAFASAAAPLRNSEEQVAGLALVLGVVAAGVGGAVLLKSSKRSPFSER